MPTEGIEMSVTVSKEDIVKAFREAGVNEKDTILIHSSLKSFGYVEGGAMSVIDAAKEAVTEEGTVVFPTLVQRDFANAYKNWDKDKSPSDVGYITEVFRKLPGSYRSDQATHSVAAWGKNALELVSEHTAYGPRQGVFGDYCFSYSSSFKVMPLPALSWSGAHSRISIFGARPFQLTRLTSFLQPFGDSDNTPKDFTISNTISDI